jgi:hypothetical protein
VQLQQLFKGQQRRHPEPVQHVQRRRAVALHGVRAGHHAVHLGVDHHAADDLRGAVARGLKKEGESGRRKITQYTRYGTLLLAIFQSLGIALALEGSPGLVLARASASA